MSLWRKRQEFERNQPVAIVRGCPYYWEMDKAIIEYAKEHLRYERETGKFFWIKVPKRMNNPRICSIGREAGVLHHAGYIKLTLKSKPVVAHRLAWAMFIGDPPPEIDHINGDRADNRLENLRAATRAQNMHNAKTKHLSSSGHKNVQWDSESGKWRVRVRVDGVRHHIGRFSELEDAVDAAQKFMREHHKEFARI